MQLNDKLFNLYNVTPDLSDRIKKLSYEVVNIDGYESDETDIYKSLMEKFKKGEISIDDIKNMPDVPQWFLNDLYNYINAKLKFGTNVTNKTLNKTRANLENYSIAKTYKFFKGLKNLANFSNDDFESNFISYSNLLLNAQQNVEDVQTERVSENYTIVNSGDMAEYVSRKDSRVRDSHEHADGTILPTTNKWWQNTGLKLLSEWGCRCNIVRSNATESVQSYQSASISPKGIETNSNVSLKDGTVIIFSEKLPMFQDLPPTLRRQFNRNGF